jgi:hypothetical protein
MVVVVVVDSHMTAVVVVADIHCMVVVVDSHMIAVVVADSYMTAVVADIHMTAVVADIHMTAVVAADCYYNMTDHNILNCHNFVVSHAIPLDSIDVANHSKKYSN